MRANASTARAPTVNVCAQMVIMAQTARHLFASTVRMAVQAMASAICSALLSHAHVIQDSVASTVLCNRARSSASAGVFPTCPIPHALIVSTAHLDITALHAANGPILPQR